MPILAREPDCFPPDLFDSLAADDLGGEARCDGRWWVARTQSRREKDLMRRLGASGVSFYCPVIGRRTRAPSGRIRESFVPLFSGYVFLHGSEEARLAALTTNCTASILAVDDQDRLIRELSQIRQLLASNLPIAPEEKLEAGRPVRVVTGPLRGQEGVVIERLGKRRLLVTVELLQRGASVDLDECDVEPI
ncbi:MAG: transcription termination/antitermination NusG family protein [Planctomycetaceae bacterium]